MSIFEIFNSPGLFGLGQQQMGNSYAQNVLLDQQRAFRQRLYAEAYNNSHAALNPFRAAPEKPLQQDCEGCGAPLRPRQSACEYCRRATPAALAEARAMQNAYPEGYACGMAALQGQTNYGLGFQDPRKLYGDPQS